MKILHPKIGILPESLHKLEKQGKYEIALAEVESFWKITDNFPDIDGLNSFEAAEIILRCGSLIGFHGHNKQIANAQETSKNFLTEARSRFTELGNIEKTAECENYLALAYWRKGEAVEAETWVESALSYNLPSSNRTKIYSHLTKSLIFLSLGRNEEIVSYLKPLETDFQKCGDAFLIGSFCANIGLAFQELGQFTEALKYLELAGFYHRKSGHQVYLGTAENNLAQIHKKIGDFQKAHEAINRATKSFRTIKDRTREGFSLDTKAQIYLEEARYKEALITIEAAIATMQKSENFAYLVETYLTKTKILVNLDEISAATLALFEAVQIAKTNISEDAANNLVKEFEKTLAEKKSPENVKKSVSQQNKNDETFELILPPPIAHYQKIQGVRIKGTHLEAFGLTKNSLAIIANVKVERGDLVAVTELETDAVICGFYDADFGIVCLENGYGEPTLFDESGIKILGKIVGVCDSEKKSEGKTFVKPLVFKR